MEKSKAELIKDLTKKWKEALKRSDIYNFDINAINWATIPNDFDESYDCLKNVFKNQYTLDMVSFLLHEVPIANQFIDADTMLFSKVIKENILIYLMNPELKDSKTLKTNLFKETLKASHNEKDNTINTKALIQDLFYHFRFSMQAYTAFALIFGYIEYTEYNIKMIFEEGEYVDGIRYVEFFDSFDELHRKKFENFNKDTVLFNILVHIFKKVFPEIGKILEKISKDEDIRYDFISFLTFEKFGNELEEEAENEEEGAEEKQEGDEGNEEGNEEGEVEEDRDYFSKKNLPLIKMSKDEIDSYAIKLANEYQPDLFFDIVASQSSS